MPELRSHKRGRSLGQRLFGNSEHRFTTASGEAEAEATTSDSEYDSDVILVVCNHIVFSHVVAMTNYLLPSPPMQNTSLMGRIL
jgi:hypothetical protein